MRAAGRWFAPMNASGGCKDVQKQPTADQETVRTASCHQPHIDRHIPACTPKPIATNDHALGGKPCSQDQARSKRSAFMPLFQATTKSLTNFSFASSCLQISAIARSCELEPKVRSTRVAVWNGGQHRGDVCRSSRTHQAVWHEHCDGRRTKRFECSSSFPVVPGAEPQRAERFRPERHSRTMGAR